MVYSYPYNVNAGSVGARTTIVKGMEATGHVTRTLTISRKSPGMLLVSRGSIDNIDTRASNPNNGNSVVKAFDLTTVPSGGYAYKTQGILMGWGLRNDVGVVEHPTTGGIWTVENSGDNIQRSGVDVHTNNPGEELNYLGTIGSGAAPRGNNFGYPYCFAAWTPSELPSNANIQVGTQFSSTPSNDTACAGTTAPYLTFPAHTVCHYLRAISLYA